MRHSIRFLWLLMIAVLVQTNGIAQHPKNPFTRGAGQLEYMGYGPLSDRPITLFYYVPTQGDISRMKILFSMHGAERSGQTQRNTWQNLAEEYGFIVLAPQFTQENGYPNNDYQFGGVSESLGNFALRPPEQWTFPVIEALFDFFKMHTGNTSKVYHFFGHSGGAQFVHRYLMVMPNARVGRAVVGNPGSYTFPDADGIRTAPSVPATPAGWPYSIQGTPFVDEAYLKPFFERDLIFMAGTLDTASVPANLPADHPINLQGAHRYERAQNFFRNGKLVANENGFNFRWQYREMPGVGHSTSKMLYGNPEVRSWLTDEDHRLYNNEDLTDIGAFGLLKDFLVVSEKTEEARRQEGINWHDPEKEAQPVLHQQLWRDDELGTFYDRLPARAKNQVRPEVWIRSRHAAGLKLVFRTDAEKLTIRYTVSKKNYAMNHFPATGVSGLDLYAENSNGSWAWANGKYSFEDTITYHFEDVRLGRTQYVRGGGRIFHMFLPLYNQVEWLEIGVPDGHTFTFLPVMADQKPIIVYGTSIAQGGCASRPGMAWTNILNRELHLPVVNLGFSNNGRMEKEVVDLIVQKEASVFILDCLPNMTLQPENIRHRMIDAVHAIRARHPETPIVLVDHSHYMEGILNEGRLGRVEKVNQLGYQTYEELQSTGVTDLYYLKNSAIGLDTHDSVDGLHPTDRGMLKYARAYAELLKSIGVANEN